MGKIIDLAAVAAKHGVQDIILPGWDKGELFECRAKRPTLYNMASLGMIPNPLLKPIQTLFSGVRKDIDEVPVADQAKSLIQMAKYALVEPTYDELTEAGLTLTDEQLLTLYAFAIGGAAALEPFRDRLRGGAGGDGEVVPDEAERVSGD